MNDDVLSNHDYVLISDIGSTNDTSFPCHTNHPPPAGSSNSGGEWFAPDGTEVVGNSVPGFEAIRAPKVVRLRRTTGTSPEGMYKCSIEDAASTTVTNYVGLYNSGGGTASKYCKFMVPVETST